MNLETILESVDESAKSDAVDKVVDTILEADEYGWEKNPAAVEPARRRYFADPLTRARETGRLQRRVQSAERSLNSRMVMPVIKPEDQEDYEKWLGNQEDTARRRTEFLAALQSTPASKERLADVLPRDASAEEVDKFISDYLENPSNFKDFAKFIFKDGPLQTRGKESGTEGTWEVYVTIQLKPMKDVDIASFTQAQGGGQVYDSVDAFAKDIVDEAASRAARGFGIQRNSLKTQDAKSHEAVKDEENVYLYKADNIPTTAITGGRLGNKFVREINKQKAGFLAGGGGLKPGEAVPVVALRLDPSEMGTYGSRFIDNLGVAFVRVS